MPSIKSGRFVTVWYKFKEDHGDTWDEEQLDRRDGDHIKLTVPAEKASMDVDFCDENMDRVEIHPKGFGIKSHDSYYWTLYSTWEDAKKAFDEACVD